MHPSPTALIAMSTDELNRYRTQLRAAMLEDPDDDFTSPYRARVDLIDAILLDRLRSERLEDLS